MGVNGCSTGWVSWEGPHPHREETNNLVCLCFLNFSGVFSFGLRTIARGKLMPPRPSHLLPCSWRGGDMAGVGAEFSLGPQFWQNQRTDPLHLSRDLRGTKALVCRGSTALSNVERMEGPAPDPRETPCLHRLCAERRASASPGKTLGLITCNTRSWHLLPGMGVRRRNRCKSRRECPRVSSQHRRM